MQGKNIFTPSEIERLKLVVIEYEQAKTSKIEKTARGKLRKLGFYVSDFGITNITSTEFLHLLQSGKIRTSVTSIPTSIPPLKKLVQSKAMVIEKSIDCNSELMQKLINGTFKKAGTVDNLVPNETGFYCIKLIKGANLPSRYEMLLNERKHRIIYIGIAQGQSLKKRFLGQELRARGHGTFFRSIGAVLGYLPEKGSLLNAKNKNNYTFTEKDEKKIISWINENLEVNWISFSGDFSVEKNWIAEHCPLLNDSHNPKRLKELRADKAYCRAVANG